jgi:malate synthase
MSHSKIGGLSVDTVLKDFIETEALPGSGLEGAAFWRGLERIIDDFAERNRALLAERDRLQASLDAWHREHPGRFDQAEYRSFLDRIGYLAPEPSAVVISTTEVDDEIATLAGPQLVVPASNARYVLNAANARWGSLYDALYGTDAIAGQRTSGGYDPDRGQQVIARVRGLLDSFVPLVEVSHADAVHYSIVDGALSVRLSDGGRAPLIDPETFVGYRGDPSAPSAILLRHHGLHIELTYDATTLVGAADRAGIADVLLESALTTIVDFEDSVATVDAEEKVAAYRNWLGLARGDLTDTFVKGGHPFTRKLSPDRGYVSPEGEPFTVPGRAVLFVRNVGHHMMTDAVLDAGGAVVGEGILDAVVTTLAALPGRVAGNALRNGRYGSIYIVKPKMHGPDEVAFTVDLFERVEDLLELPRGTIKLGLMDEERRMSVNLLACMAVARERLVFINTGFLDRSGDEIHTSMEAGPMTRKAELRRQPWIQAYEDRNVDIGLAAGLPGHGQIGKGMWAMPDQMSSMLEQKIGHPESGASTAWVPSPTAATLHALHYHAVDVRARQIELTSRPPASVDDLLTPPLSATGWTAEQIQEELDGNTQSILGYVVRWIDDGIGCSKVPDIHGTALMEDRATLRISSQLLANWLRHGVITEDDVRRSLERMASIVDAQNGVDDAYRPMTSDIEGSIAYQTASDLILLGTQQPNGYTEPILHRRRRERKAAYSAETREVTR